MTISILLPSEINEIPDLLQIAGVKSRERKSKFIKPYWGKDKPKPAGVLCFPFHEAAWSNGCLANCDYCYLKGTFRYGLDYDGSNNQQGWNGHEQVVFSNVEDLYAEAEKFLSTQDKPTILHTGELADSLIVPGSEKIMSRLITRFGQQDKHTLLLLTKSDNVDALLNLEHNGRTVAGFSINASPVADLYEQGTAPTWRRIEAAKKCIRAGYRVLARIDPMIPIPNWQAAYSELFERINELTEMGLYGVVVGTLRGYEATRRAMPVDLKSMLMHRDIDKRYHIDEETRDAMYGLAFRTLKSKQMGVCKESGEMWGRLISTHGPRNFVCNCHLPEAK